MSVLKNVVDSMRDKERKAIMEEDQRMAQTIFDRTKKAKTTDDEKLTEKEEIKSNVSYAIEKKFMALEQAIKEETAGLQGQKQQGKKNFNDLVAVYNNLCMYINKIAKYSNMTHDQKSKIDRRFEQINVFLNDLIFASSQNNVQHTDLQVMSNYISANNYKTVGILDATSFLKQNSVNKENYMNRAENLLKSMDLKLHLVNKEDVGKLTVLRSRLAKLLNKKMRLTNFNLKRNADKVLELKSEYEEILKKYVKDFPEEQEHFEEENQEIEEKEEEDIPDNIEDLPFDEQQEIVNRLIKSGNLSFIANEEMSQNERTDSDDENGEDSDDFDATTRLIFGDTPTRRQLDMSSSPARRSYFDISNKDVGFDAFVNDLKQREQKLEPFLDSPIQNDGNQNRGRNTGGLERYRKFMDEIPSGVSRKSWLKKWKAQENDRKNENKKQNAQNKQQKGKLEKKRRGRKG